MTDAVIDLDSLTFGEAPKLVKVVPGGYNAIFKEFVLETNKNGKPFTQMVFETIEVVDVNEDLLDAIDGGEDALVGKIVKSDQIWIASDNRDYVGRGIKAQVGIVGIDYDSEIKGKKPSETKAYVEDKAAGDEVSIFIKWEAMTKQDGSPVEDENGDVIYKVIAVKGRS